MPIKFCANPATWHPTIHRDEKHHHPPRSWTDDDGDSSEIIPLCGLCHNEYHALLNEYVRHNDTPPWEIRKTYSVFIRNLVAEAWKMRIPGKTPFTFADPIAA